MPYYEHLAQEIARRVTAEGGASFFHGHHQRINNIADTAQQGPYSSIWKGPPGKAVTYISESLVDDPFPRPGGRKDWNFDIIGVTDEKHALSIHPANGLELCTWLRDSGSTVVDWEGRVVECIPHEARCQGARRVENLVARAGGNSGTLAGYTTGDGAIIIDEEAGIFSVTTANNSRVMCPQINYPNGIIGHSLVARVKLSGPEGETFRIQLSEKTPPYDAGTRIITLSQTPKWYSIFKEFTNAGVNLVDLRLRGDGTAITVTMHDYQVEDVTGQSNQNPAEYVSAGVGTIELNKNTQFDVLDGWDDLASDPERQTFVSNGHVVCDSVQVGATPLLRHSTDQTIIEGRDYLISFNVISFENLSSSYLQIRLKDSGSSDGGISIVAGQSHRVIITAGALLGNPRLCIYQNSASGLLGQFVLDNVSFKLLDHGANVDGVAYFPYENGNRVDADGVVAEGQGPRFQNIPGWLMEPERTNLASQSQDFSDPVWGKFGSWLPGPVTAGPDGVPDSSPKVAETTESSNHRLQHSNISVTNGVVYTISCSFAPIEYDWVQLASAGNMFSTGVWANFDVANGVVGNVGPDVIAVGIESQKNGFYRCYIVAQANATQIGYGITIFLTQGIDTTERAPIYTGNGSSGLFYFGASMEEGHGISSYIPTSGAAVTRLADQPEYDNANWPENEGSTEFKITVPWPQFDDGTDMVIAAVNDQATLNSIFVRDTGDAPGRMSFRSRGNTGNTSIANADGTQLNQEIHVRWRWNATLGEIQGSADGLTGVLIQDFVPFAKGQPIKFRYLASRPMILKDFKMSNQDRGGGWLKGL